MSYVLDEREWALRIVGLYRQSIKPRRIENTWTNTRVHHEINGIYPRRGHLYTHDADVRVQAASWRMDPIDFMMNSRLFVQVFNLSRFDARLARWYCYSVVRVGLGSKATG